MGAIDVGIKSGGPPGHSLSFLLSRSLVIRELKVLEVEAKTNDGDFIEVARLAAFVPR